MREHETRTNHSSNSDVHEWIESKTETQAGHKKVESYYLDLLLLLLLEWSGKSARH